ncbi:uncharacterized protein LOC121186218 isoform X2 [Toxotes jaculatrix]|uniref:uncharacterized protein LOC121186218 isoform X2 n=1 Tax=Toxotes jaculatrix TaxID=941984 RepID=UPI001B3AB360|nr:uncharacterized protein LOC121186218 isoform X2 [Toxotes jaculatrix]
MRSDRSGPQDSQQLSFSRKPEGNMDQGDLKTLGTILTGFSLLCGGRKPSYCCVRFNVTLHLATLMFSAVAFGTMVRHVPYCKSSCGSVNRETTVLVGGILAVLITILLVETLVSLGVILTGLCSMFFNHPQEPEDPERNTSTTSEPLCLPPQQHLVTPAGENMKTDG